MDHLTHRRGAAGAFKRAILFAALFVVVILLFIITSKVGKGAPGTSPVISSLADYKDVPEYRKDQLKARNAGFWEYASDTNTNSIFSTADRFELKPNGIFWQVSGQTIVLPSKSPARMVHIVEGYMNPFSGSGANLDSLECSIRIIRQIYITNNDTCYGESNTDTSWNVVADGRRFQLGGRVYRAYDTAGPALQRFFPAGALGLVDKLVMHQCAGAGDFYSWAKNAVAADMRGLEVAALSGEEVRKIIDVYYRVFLGRLIGDRLAASGGQKQMLKASFDVNWQGGVANVKIVTATFGDKELRERAGREIGSWVFPRLKAPAAPLHMEKEFRF